MKDVLAILRRILGIYIGSIMISMLNTGTLSYSGLIEGAKYLLYTSPLIIAFYFYHKDK